MFTDRSRACGHVHPVDHALVCTRPEGHRIDHACQMPWMAGDEAGKWYAWPRSSESVRTAAVAYIEREDGRILCVWNARYRGWSLPGGMVEEGETAEQAVRRELKEETGMLVQRCKSVFVGPHGLPHKPGRASHVEVFAVQPIGEPRAMEDGCPVTWITRGMFLAKSPFGSFYAKVFREQIPIGTYEETTEWP